MSAQVDTSGCGWAERYFLGQVPEGELAAVKAHLDACESCLEELDSLRETADSIALLAPEVDPPEDLELRLYARLGVPAPVPRADAPVQPWKDWSNAGSAAARTILRASDGAWEPTGVAGVEVRRLFLDAANDRVTMLVRMAAGTAYPAHRHGGFEECYVLQGDLLVGDTRMHPGDYQRVEGGSLHGVQSTAAGCLLLITSSLHDELLDGAHV